MSCDEIRPELLGFHFGETEPEPRQTVEQHLLGCRSCLEEFLDLKRAVEAPDLEHRPSAAARDRLRRAVAAEVAPPAPAWSWWERPAAFLFAGATVLAAIFALHAVATGPVASPHSLPEPPRLIQSP